MPPITPPTTVPIPGARAVPIAAPPLAPKKAVGRDTAIEGSTCGNAFVKT